MKLPLLVHASPKAGLRTSAHIFPGRWRVDIENLSTSSFKFVQISGVFPEGFELDLSLTNFEFTVTCPTRIVCNIVHVGEEKNLSIYLRHIKDGLQYHSDAGRATGTSG